jgi:hypothetical protein
MPAARIGEPLTLASHCLLGPLSVLGPLCVLDRRCVRRPAVLGPPEARKIQSERRKEEEPRHALLPTLQPKHI